MPSIVQWVKIEKALFPYPFSRETYLSRLRQCLPEEPKKVAPFVIMGADGSIYLVRVEVYEDFRRVQPGLELSLAQYEDEEGMWWVT